MNSWFGVIKVMQRQEVETQTELEDIITYPDYGDDEDDDCQCEEDTSCPNTATFKNEDIGLQICGTHLSDYIDAWGGKHGFRKWDCTKGEYL